MDAHIRQLERLAHEEPEAYYRAIRRSGELDRLKATDKVLWLETLRKCNRLGPTNLEALGMLGFRPAVMVMGGDDEAHQDCYFWFRGRWYTEAEVHHQSDTWHGWWRGRDARTYTKCLNRLSFWIRRIKWMHNIAKTLTNKRPLGEWLYELENRIILQHHIVDGLN